MFLRNLWHWLGSVHLAIILPALIIADLAVGFFSLKTHGSIFEPLNDMGLLTWTATYGRHNLQHTAWFFVLMGLLFCFVVNTFVCTTDRTAALLRRRQHGLIFRLAPHIMHYAVVVILFGYLSSYLFSQVHGNNILLPGRSVDIPGSSWRVRLASLDIHYYDGERLGFLTGQAYNPDVHLVFENDGKTFKRILSCTRPTWIGGYAVHLKDFAPRLEAYKDKKQFVNLTIKKDAGVVFYFAGMLLFVAGLVLYLYHWGVVHKRRASGMSKEGL